MEEPKQFFAKLPILSFQGFTQEPHSFSVVFVQLLEIMKDEEVGSCRFKSIERQTSLPVDDFCQQGTRLTNEECNLEESFGVPDDIK